MKNTRIILAIFVVLVMIGSAFAIMNSSDFNNQSAISLPPTQSVNPTTSSSPAWTYPTTTMDEPGYTGGTFLMGIGANIGSVNPLTSDTGCDLALCEEIFEPLYKSMINGSNEPWLATGYHLSLTSGKTFDVETSSYQNYSAVYTVYLRPNVQWTDWTQANSKDTYEFSNTVVYGNATGVSTSHTFKTYNTTTMRSYYLQSGDVVLSYRMEASYGKWQNVVNVVPDGNLSVKVFVSKANLLFVSNDLANVILPYNIWSTHDYSSLSSHWNYTPSLPPTESFNSWQLGYNEKTGNVPYLVGTGPFMVSGGYGQPDGGVIQSQAFTIYVNPHYWVQYTPKNDNLRQYTPKIAEVEVIYYSSASDEVSAMIDGNIYSMLGGTSPNFAPLLKSVPDVKICSTPAGSGGFSLFSLNTRYSPLNVTAFRQALNYATPKAYLSSVIESGYCVPGQPVVGPNDVLYFNSSTNPYTFSLSKAKSLIDGIKGMVNVSGVLEYYGKPVSLTIQLPSTLAAPLAVESAEIVKSDWSKLGISVTLDEVAFTTEISNVDSSICNNDTQYQVATFESGAPIGDPAQTLLCDYNSVIGIPSCSYSGPFSSLTYNGKYYTGPQMDSLLNNLTFELEATDNLSVAIKLSKTIEGIGVDESPIINLGYILGLSPISTAKFVNYSISNIESTGWPCEWNFLTMHESSSSTSINYHYHLSITGQIENGSIISPGGYEKILFTVTNQSNGNPVANANVEVGYTAPFGGLLNITSSSLVTNSNGQVVYELKILSASQIKSLMNVYYYANCSGPKVNYYNEQVSISASAYISGNSQVQPADYKGNITVVNSFKYPLKLSLHLSKVSGLKAGDTDTATFLVTNSTSGKPVSGAYVNTNILLNGKLSYSSGLIKTNATGQAAITFKVPAGFSSGTNMTLNSVACINPSNTTSQTGAGYASVSVIAAKSSTSSMSIYYLVGGVIAVVVIVGAAALVLRSRKKK